MYDNIYDVYYSHLHECDKDIFRKKHKVIE